MTSRTILSKPISGGTVSLVFSPISTGICLAAAGISLIACYAWSAWAMGLLFAALFTLAGTVRLQGSSPLIHRLCATWYVLVLIGLNIIAPMMVETFSFLRAGLLPTALCLVCCCIIWCGFLTLTGRPRLSLTLASLLLLLHATVNSYVYLFRSRELSFLDIYAASTAMDVVGQYRFDMTWLQLCGLLLGALLLLLQLCLPPQKCRSPIRNRLLGLGLTAALCLTLHVGGAELGPYSWGRDGSRKNGTFLNFYLTLRYSRVDAPEGYSKDTVEQIAQSCPAEPINTQQSTPNIIVIMDEAMADFSLFPHPPATNIPVTPFMDSLQTNVTRGHALASVYGGNTANSEYEFLTGHSMAFLPDSAVPYQQYIHQPVYSLAWYLRSLGYTCQATHSYAAKGWARDLVYPHFGFEKSVFMDEYPCRDYERYYISDREQFTLMLDMLTGHTADTPLFLFGVTMQNHGGYTYTAENYHQSVTLEGYDTPYPQAEQYLSLLHETDKAFADLIAALEDFPEDTVVLIFGDHFPLLEDSFYEALNGGPLLTTDEQMLRYRVPFLIWANYDLPTRNVENTSLNYLSLYLLEAAGLPKNSYYNFLSRLEQAIPAMNAYCYYSTELGLLRPYSELTDQTADLLRRYEMLHYNNILDPKNQNETLFAQYLP